MEIYHDAERVADLCIEKDFFQIYLNRNVVSYVQISIYHVRFSDILLKNSNKRLGKSYLSVSNWQMRVVYTAV